MKDEVDTLHSTQIPESAYNKLLNSIVRIEVEDRKGTGFFVRFNKMFTLFTNFHVIPQNLVNSKKTIRIFFGIKGNETEKYIKLDKNQRFIKCFNKPKDVTVIEILKNDNIPEDKYLIPDMNYKNGGFNFYLNSDFYLAGYPSVDDIYIEYEGERHISSGKIKKVFNDFEFEHTLDTRCGSSGSPICLINNRCVIGIHKSGNKNTHINQGTFLGVILEKLEKNKEYIETYITVVSKPGQKCIKVNRNDLFNSLKDKLKDFCKENNIKNEFQILYDGCCYFCDYSDRYRDLIRDIERELEEDDDVDCLAFVINEK